MASLKTTLQSAPGPMLGYIFQIERALEWLSKTAENGSVSIETDDDLVIELGKGITLEKIYEQDKSAALSNRNPFSNKSVDLWKTLRIWAENISNGVIDINNATFLLTTNKTIKGGLFKKLLKSKNDPGFEKMIQEFIEQAISTDSAEIKSYVEVVASLPENTRTGLFRKIELLDINYKHDRESIKASIRSNLHISPEIPYNKLYADLLGWLTDLIITKWVNAEPAIVQGKELNLYLTDLIKRYSSKPFMEKAKSVLPVQDKDRVLHQQDNFVRQLEWIELEEEYVIHAIDDFIRARWERSRFALEGNIPSKEDFIDMHDDLIDRWNNLQAPVARSCVNEQDRKEKGYQLYWSVLNHKATLASYQTEQAYTTKGAYHLLANDFKIGWHFDWKTLKDQSNES